MSLPNQKLYCYVDETGQDTGSEYFITAVVISQGNQQPIRQDLEIIERQTKIFKRKWYRAGSEQRMRFIEQVFKYGNKFGRIFYAVHQKPTRTYSAWTEAIVSAVTEIAPNYYRARVYVDGIDHKKATQLTKILRARGIKLSMVRTTRDETEVMIRLADRMAGLVRAANEQQSNYAELLAEGKNIGIIKKIKTTP
jgi:hypothetical protein